MTAHNAFSNLTGSGSRLAHPGDQTCGRPVRILFMGGGHVFVLGTASILGRNQGMTGDTRAFVKYLNDLVGQTDIDFLFEKLVGHTVEAVVDSDMVVDMNARPAPESNLVRTGRQGTQRRFVSLRE